MVDRWYGARSSAHVPCSTSVGASVPLARPFRTGIATVASLALVAALLAVPASPAAATGADVRISEVAVNGPAGPTDEFVELVNLGDAPADLRGWRLYRCAATGMRQADPQTPPFGGYVLGPGQRVVLAHAGASEDVLAVAATTYTGAMADHGTGVWLADPTGRRVDAVAFMGPGQDSECGHDAATRPNVADPVLAHSHQRVATTGDADRDWIVAPRTPGAPNATTPDTGVASSDVVVTELANGGPNGSWDVFVEVSNRGQAVVPIGGWSLSRCQADGMRFATTRQATVPAGVQLAPGDSFVFRHTSVPAPAGVPSVTFPTSLANAGFGVILEDADGVRRDAVGVYDRLASPCTQGTALANRLDFVGDETYQRRTDTGDNAADFHVRPRTIGRDVVPDPADDPVPPQLDGPLRITEVAPDDLAGSSHAFVELANLGDTPVSLAGVSLHRCQPDGFRAADVLLGPLGDVTLAPGETFVTAAADSPLAAEADATHTASLHPAGFGVRLHGADGRLLDRFSAYVAGPVGGPARSHCTQELHASVALDLAAGQSFQRVGTGSSDARDFVAAVRTPGELPDLRRPTERTAEELAPVAVDPVARPTAPDGLRAEDRDDGRVDLRARAHHATGRDSTLVFHAGRRLAPGTTTAVATGVSDTAPPSVRVPAGESPVAAAARPIDGQDAPDLTTAASDGYPYQRFRLAVDPEDLGHVEVVWTGRSTASNELQLYVWDHGTGGWERLDADGGVADAPITLVGHAEVAATVRDGHLDVLVQDGPRTAPAFQGTDQVEDAFADPATYAGALAVLADTQFLAQHDRDVFADLAQWIAQHQGSRRIAHTVHLGDIIQSWQHGTDREDVAREEFQAASEVFALLEEVGHPYSVLPGNHDDKWGRDKALYNEFFGPDRFAGAPWYLGPWRPGDNDHHAALVDVGGLELLVVSLGFGAGEEAIAWANATIAAHPDHDVVLATHQYLDSAGNHTTPTTTRWDARGREYFERIVAPNENVFLVLSGHHYGIAHAVRRAADGVQGDGRVVHELLQDHSAFARPDGRSTGFLRLLQFDLDAGAVAVDTYSPTLDEHGAAPYDHTGWYPADLDTFTFEVDLRGAYDRRVETELVGLQAPSVEVGRRTVADGDVATVTHDADGRFGWYVTAAADGEVARRAGGAAGQERPPVSEPPPTSPPPTEPPPTEPPPSEPPPTSPPPTSPPPTSPPPTSPPPASGDTVRCPRSTPSFRDVPSSSVHATAIGCLAGLEIVLGRGDRRFEPDGTVTRAQAASMIHRLLRAYGVATPTGRGFRDVSAASPHAPAIASLAAMDVIAGRGGGRFDPDASLTRAQMASILARTVPHLTGRALPAGPDAFRDDDGSPHEAAIDATAAAGLVAGRGGGRFAPSEDVRRDQLATFLARVVERY
ncbi:hypothetical protein FTX61_03705 [Nitriliruptoraceae bacterium ZYF776]|nr:hypothetical protein [Profundirhabdus halotolerans]